MWKTYKKLSREWAGMWEDETYRVAFTQWADVEECKGLFALEELHRWDLAWCAR
jgi:hypothetical protein